MKPNSVYELGVWYKKAVDDPAPYGVFLQLSSGAETYKPLGGAKGAWQKAALGFKSGDATSVKVNLAPGWSYSHSIRYDDVSIRKAR